MTNVSPSANITQAVADVVIGVVADRVVVTRALFVGTDVNCVVVVVAVDSGVVVDGTNENGRR